MRILHLSDLHFGTIPADSDAGRGNGASTRSTHTFSSGGKPDPTKLVEILGRNLASSSLDAIVVSGDVGWSGSAEDYAYALDFFGALRQELGKSVPLIVVPGNHDVDREAAQAGGDPQDAFVGMLRKLYKRSLPARYPLHGLRQSQPSKRQRLVAFEHIPNHLLIVAVNSAAQLATSSAPVFVDPDLLPLIEGRIRAMGVSSRALRVFVVHHHLLPFAEPPWRDEVEAGQIPDKADDTIVANSAKLQAWLADNAFRLVLHGHKHLSHGREDVLWRQDDPPDGRRLMVIGAGSAGVYADERSQGELLSYNVIEGTRLADERWNIRTEVFQINDARGVREARRLYAYGATVGPSPASSPVVFCAERMDDCHRAISATTRGVPMRNFMSVVENHEYAHPPTARIGEREPSYDEVESSFRALHPEWEPGNGWDPPSRVDQMLRDLPSRYQFQHGPRLFGIPGRAGVQARRGRNVSALQPLRHVVDNLRGNETRAYVGLYNADIDVATEREPLPGLMSIQFVPDGDYLDVVATFRKLELSFWWVVNMLEIGLLLRWGAEQGRKKYVPRRVTFFAALAEWKDNPEATFVTKLDAMPLGELTALVLAVNSRKPEARDRLIDLLRDKVDRTNDVNIDPAGLERLAELLRGIIDARGGRAGVPQSSPITSELGALVAEAARETRAAVETKGGDRPPALRAARERLRRVIAVLDESR